MPRKPNTAHQCEHIKQNGEQCQRYANHRNPTLDAWFCAPHKKSSTVPGRPALSKNTRSYRAQKKRQRTRKSAEDCVFTTKRGILCKAPVVSRLDDGRNVCKHHLEVYRKVDEQQRKEMEAVAVDSLIDVRALGKRRMADATVTRRHVVDMPDIEDQLELLDKEDKKRGNKIRFRQPDPTKIGNVKSAFFGVDVEYYTPEFKVDYVYMLISSIRRSEAQVNILFQQLQRIEDEENEIKEIESRGTNVVDGKMIQFQNKTIRHATPVELKIKLMEALAKAETHHAKLLKQMEELPLTCLMVMRKLGVRWDREASMMVINKLEKEHNQVLTDFGMLDVEPIPPIPLSQALEVVNEDPKMAKSLKKLMQDDDW